MKNCCRSVACYSIVGSIGILLMVAGSILIGLKVADQIVNTEINKETVLSLNSPLISQWLNPKPPIYMQYWFFNVANPENISRGGKPTVKEIGPFTYRLYQPKEDVGFFVNNTVMYKYNHTLVFQRDMSYSDVDFKITQLNVPLLILENMLMDLPPWVPTSWIHLILKALDDTDLFVEHSVHEWLFGYPDPVFKLLHALLDIVGIKMQSQFGFFLGYNNSNDGLYLADTGKENIFDTNAIRRWNGEKSLSYWSSPDANMINGTENCFDSGVLNVGPCKQEAPILLSSPHFYLAADQYKNGVNGIHPEKEEHETVLDIEPMTGFLFAAMKRLQVNVHLKSSIIVEQTQHVTEVILPALWLNQSVMLDGSTADSFNSQVISLITVVHVLPYVILGIGLFLIVLGVGLLLYKFLKGPTGTLLVTDDGTDDETE